MEGSGAVGAAGAVNVNNREGKYETEHIKAAIGGGNHQRSSVQEDHQVGALLAAIPHAHFIDSREVAVEGSPEAFRIVVGGEIEKGGKGVVGFDGEVVHRFGCGGASGLFD